MTWAHVINGTPGLWKSDSQKGGVGGEGITEMLGKVSVRWIRSCTVISSRALGFDSFLSAFTARGSKAVCSARGGGEKQSYSAASRVSM